MISYPKIFSRIGLLLVIVLSACNLNRAAIVWTHDVKPQFVCPGDSVSLSWDGGDEAGCLGGGCPEVVVSISSNPSDVPGMPLNGGRVRGETAAGPISGNTSFTFSASGGRDRREPATHDVNVVLPERETNAPLNFASVCSGSSAVWRDADLSIPEFRSEGVRLVRVCNTSGNQIRLTLSFESGTQAWTLLPGRCTEDLPAEMGYRVLSANAISLFSISPPVHCDTSLSSLPPDLHLSAALACDMMSSASMPIVAATAGGSDITLFPSETPTIVPYILVIQVPANCRQGPGVEYPVVNSAQPGVQVHVIGKSVDGAWWYSQIANDKCFISNIAGIPSGDLSQLSIITDRPKPAPTPTPKPEKVEPTDKPTNPVIVEIDYDGDGYPASKDCNDKDAKVNPGAVETPKDGVDSNCNGDDDK